MTRIWINWAEKKNAFHHSKPVPVFWRCLIASSGEAVETLICLESHRCVVTASCYCYLIGADVSRAGPQRNNTIQTGAPWRGASYARHSDLIVRQGLSGRRSKSRPCPAQTRAKIGWILRQRKHAWPLSHSSPPQLTSHTHCQGSTQLPYTQPGKVTHWSHSGPFQP